MRFPSIAEVTSIILAEMVSAFDPNLDENQEDTSCDVRLVFGRIKYASADVIDPTWTVNVGSGDYDQWHGLACGASSFDMCARPTKKAAEEIARDLLNQVRDGMAQLPIKRNRLVR